MYNSASKEWIENILLQESARWKALLAAGKLSKSALRRIQKLRGKGDPLYVKQLLKGGKKEQAKEYLKKKGIIKSAKDWLAGVEKGTQNIIKKAGAKETKRFGTTYARSQGAKEFGGKTFKEPLYAHTQVSQKGRITVHTPSHVPKKRQAISTVVKRHEAEEAKAASRMWKKHRGHVGVAATVGPGHMSDSVIKAEKKLTDISSKLYGRKFNKPGDLKDLLKYRKQTGEYEKIKGISKKMITKTEDAIAKQVGAQLKGLQSAPNMVKLQTIAQVKPLLSKNDLAAFKKKIKYTGKPTAPKKDTGQS